MSRFDSNEDNVVSKLTQNKGLLKKAGLGFAAVLLAWNSFTTLDETERGLQYRFGKLLTNSKEELMRPGFNLKWPWISVRKARVDQQHIDMEGLATYTKDNQPITAKITLLFQTPENKLVDIFRKNPNWKEMLESTATDGVKTALGQTDAPLVASNREQIMKEVTKETTQKTKDLLNIEVQQVLMPNFDFNDDFEKAVALAANEKAKLLQKQTQYEQSLIDKKKQIVESEATAQVIKNNADATAYATLTTKQAEAEGFDKVQKVVGMQNMGTYLVTNRWNGVGPFSVGSANVMDVAKLAPVMK